MATIVEQKIKSDLVYRLRNHPGLGLDAPSLMNEAADEIAQLRHQLRWAKDQISPTVKYDEGYAAAQRDIRKALGVQ